MLEPPAPQRVPHWDFRLVPAALSTWIVVIIVLTWPHLGHMLSAGVGIVLAVAALIHAARSRTRQRWLFISVACVGVVYASTVLTLAPSQSGPIAAAVTSERTVTVTAQLLSDGRVRPSQGSIPAQREFRAEVRQLDDSSGSWTLSAPVLLRTPLDVVLPPAGSVVEFSGRLRGADWTPTYAAIVAVKGYVTQLESPNPMDAGVNAVRQGLRDSMAGVPPRSGALVAGLAIGDESNQSPLLAEQMRISGLSHLTAVSGGNIAILLGAVVIFGRILAFPVWSRAIVGALAVLAYVQVVGPEPSVLRAAGMGTVAVLAIVVGGPRRGLPALSATIIVLLVLAPPLATSLGFALSATATAGLLLIAPLLRNRMRQAARWAMRGRCPNVSDGLADATSLTIAAQIATAPLIASLGGGLSLVAVPANVLAAPAVAPVTLLGLLAAVSAPLLPPMGTAFGVLAAPAAGWIAWWAATLSNLPVATLPWPGGWLGALAMCALIVAVVWLVVLGRRHNWPLRTITVGGLALVVTIALRPADRAGWPPPDWVAVACDVGQGDGLVISTGPGSAVVVDAGPDPGVIDQCLVDLGITHVSALVLSHFHQDHIGGTPGVIRQRQVDQIIVTPVREPITQADQVDQWAAAAGIEVMSATSGEVRRIGTQVAWEVLWPKRRILAGSVANNASLVLLVEAAGLRLLLLGDVEPEAQVALRSIAQAQQVDVVKVAHHGSRSQDPRLPQWSGGRVAIISVGADNGYGHPAPETMAAWAQQVGAVFRTDLDGDIAIVADRAGEVDWGVVTRR